MYQNMSSYDISKGQHLPLKIFERFEKSWLEEKTICLTYKRNETEPFLRQLSASDRKCIIYDNNM